MGNYCLLPIDYLLPIEPAAKHQHLTNHLCPILQNETISENRSQFIFFLQVRYFTPPQADQPEIFIMAEQEGYGGNYGGDGTKPGRHVFSFRYI